MSYVPIIDKAVSTVFNVSVESLHNRDRRRSVIDARHFAWFFLRSYFGMDALDIASEYSTTPRNVFYGYSIIKDGVVNHPFYITYYKEIEGELRKSGIRVENFSALVTKATFSIVKDGASMPKWTSKGFSIPLFTRKMYEDGTIEYGTGVSVNIPMGYIGILFVKNDVQPVGRMHRTKVQILEAGESGEIKVSFNATSEDFLKGQEKEKQVAQLVTMRIPEF